MKHSVIPPSVMTQSTGVSLAGRGGGRAAAAVDRASRSESGHATTRSQPMGAGHVTAPTWIPGNVRLVSAQVGPWIIWFTCCILFILVLVS